MTGRCAQLGAQATPARCAFVALAVLASASATRNDTDVVYQHIKDSANQTFREASGVLRFPYQVPGTAPLHHLTVFCQGVALWIVMGTPPGRPPDKVAARVTCWLVALHSENGAVRCAVHTPLSRTLL
jgi:hypothetical protein